MPLTRLDNEEKLFRDTVRRFARERIAPLVREMDESCVFSKTLIQEFFDLVGSAGGGGRHRASGTA